MPAPTALRAATLARFASLPSGTRNVTEPAAAFWASVSRSSPSARSRASHTGRLTPCSSPTSARTASASRLTHGVPSGSAPPSPARRRVARSTLTVVWRWARSTIGLPTWRASVRARRTSPRSMPSALVGRAMSDPPLEESADTGVAPQQLHRVGRVAGDVAVADEHPHVGGQALGAQGGGAEAGGHGEEDHGATLGGGEDRAALAPGGVDAHDGDVGRPAGGGDGVPQRDRVAGVGDRDGVGEAGGSEEVVLGLVGHDADRAGGAGLAGGGQAEGAGLARSPDDRDDRGVPAGDVLLNDAGGESRSAADVHHAEREGRVEVVGDDGGDRAAEQHGVAVARHLLAVAVPSGQAVLDDERGQREA